MTRSSWLAALLLGTTPLSLVACGPDESVEMDPHAEQLNDAMSKRPPMMCPEVPYLDGVADFEYPCIPEEPPPPPSPPSTPVFRPRHISELYATAQQMGVPPIVAGVPNIVQHLEAFSPPLESKSYPSGSTSTQDFVDRLFRDGIWRYQTPGVTGVTPGSGDPACTLNRVSAVTQPELFVSSDAGGGYLFPGGIVQGQFLNLGVGALTPIHIPYTKRDPVHLASTFYQSAVSPTATLSDVTSTIGQMLQAAPSQANVKTFFDSTTASSVEEASMAFKLDAKILGAGVKASLSQDVTRRENTVYAFFIQQLFAVRADLRGERPIQGLFNNNLTVADLESLGAYGELGYENLPTYIDSVTYGRLLIFSMTSSYSSSEVKAALDMAFGPNSGSLSARQKSIIEKSRINVFAYGGPFKPTADSIKDGTYVSFFNTTDIPLTTAQPIGYTVRMWNNQPGPMFRTTEYTTRDCKAIHDVRVEISNVYKDAGVYLTRSTGGGEIHIGTTGGDMAWDLTGSMSDGDDHIRIANTGARRGFPPNWQRSVTVRVLVNGEVKFNSTSDCKWCHSDPAAFRLRVNRVTGSVTPY